MKATKITFNGGFRIKVDFPFNQETMSRIRTIEGARWSRNLKAWHIPYRKDAFEQLKALFPEVEHSGKSEENRSVGPMEIAPHLPGKQGIRVEVLGQKILVRMPKEQTDITFIRGLRYSRWDAKQFCWVVNEMAKAEPLCGMSY